MKVHPMVGSEAGTTPPVPCEAIPLGLLTEAGAMSDGAPMIHFAMFPTWVPSL